MHTTTEAMRYSINTHPTVVNQTGWTNHYKVQHPTNLI